LVGRIAFAMPHATEDVKIFISFLSFVCPKERNKEKGSQKQMLRCFWQANAHEQSLFL
jgi:hypothetical protein